MKKVKKLFGIFSNLIFIRALLQGASAGVEHVKVLKTLGIDFRHVVDIGANRGQFALVARKCFPLARIDSFEPLCKPAEIFERVFIADANTHIHKVAIGPDSKVSLIHVSNRDDSSSLLPISDLQTALFPSTGEKETRQIEVAPLAAMLAEGVCKPALLKIDVQGYELSVLRGCLPLLADFDCIYVECSFVELYVGQALAYEVISFLAEQQFHLVGVYNLHYDSGGRAIQADLCFGSH